MVEQPASSDALPKHPSPRFRDRRLLAVLFTLVVLGSVWLWRSAQPLQTFSCSGEARWISFSPDGKMLAMIVRQQHQDQGVSLWDTSTWRPLRMLPGKIYAFWFLPNSQSLVTFTDDYAAEGPKGSADTAVLKRLHPDWTSQQIQTQVFDQDEHTIFQRWDVTTGKRLLELTLPPGVPVAVSRDRQWVVVSEQAHSGFTIRDMMTGHVVCATPYDASVPWPALSPDKKLLATGNVGRDSGKQGLWDLRAGTRITALDGKAEAVEATQFSRDGKVLATAAKDGISLWDTQTWRRLRTLSADYARLVFQPHFSSDGKFLVSGGESRSSQEVGGVGRFRVDCWDATTGRLIRGLPDQYLVGASPDGRFAITQEMEAHSNVATSRYGLWEIATGKLLRELPDVSDWGFSPDSRVLLTSIANYGTSLNPEPADFTPQVRSIFKLWRIPRL